MCLLFIQNPLISWLCLCDMFLCFGANNSVGKLVQGFLDTPCIRRTKRNFV